MICNSVNSVKNAFFYPGDDQWPAGRIAEGYFCKCLVDVINEKDPEWASLC